MNTNDTIQMGLQLLYWLAISAGIGIPLAFCGYVVITPTHVLAATWQNYKMRRQPHRALKDRHFKGLPRKIRRWKVVAVFGFLLFLALALEQFHVDVVGLLQHVVGS
jgi:hypothetical protein